MDSFWQNKRVLITGNTGFKGSWLSIWLKELNAEVFGYALSPLSTPNMYTACKLKKIIPSEMNDIADFENLCKFLKTFAAIIVP